MRNVILIRAIACTMVLLALVAFQNAQAQTAVTPAEARVIAKEAYIYANPLVDSYEPTTAPDCRLYLSVAGGGRWSLDAWCRKGR